MTIPATPAAEKGTVSFKGCPEGGVMRLKLLKHFRNKMQYKLGASAYKCLIM
jgi:hypothetical protein